MTGTPSPADDLADAFGVVTHFHFRGSGYADVARVLPLLSELGVRYVRNRLSPQPEVLDAFESLSSLGVKVQGVCGRLGDLSESMAELMRLVVDRYPDPRAVFAAFEGINEPNNNRVPWVAETRARTRQLRQARDAQGLDSIPIVAPALARVGNARGTGEDTYDHAGQLGDLTPWVDYGNIHVYPRGLQPSEDIDYFVAAAQRVSGSLPIVCTEGGYFTAEEYQGGAFAVPREVAAVYTPQMLLEHWLAGHPRFFRYELLDDPGAQAERESSFGLVERLVPGAAEPGRPKPDFVAMRRLLRLFADPGRSFRPSPVDYTLVGPEDLRWSAFARRDGAVLLCLWLDRPVYDPVTRSLTEDLRAPLDTVELTIGREADVSLESLVAPGVETPVSAVSSLTVDLPAGVTVVTIR